MALLIIVIVALGLRLLHLWALLATPFPRFPVLFDQSDMHAYWAWARAIAAGDLLGRDTYHPYFEWMKAVAPEATWHRWWGGKEIFQQAPLYPYLLAALLALGRGSVAVALGAQLVLGALSCVIVHRLGARLFGPPTGLAAAALAACYGPLLFHQGTLLRDWLPPILEPLALLALLRAADSGRQREAGLAGLALGLALLARETVVLFAPCALGWLGWTLRREPRRATVAALAFLAGLALALAPLAARNVAVGAPPLAISNRAAEAVIVGHAADGFPIGLVHPASMGGILERADGRLLDVVRGTLATWRGDWPGFASVQALKLRAVLDPIEVPNNLSVEYGLAISPALRVTLRFGLLLPLAVVGLVLGARREPAQALLWLFALCALAGLVGTAVLGRYRLALVPVLLLYAAAGIVALAGMIRARRWRPALAAVAALAGLLWLEYRVVPIPALRDMDAIAVHRPEYLLAAEAHARDGRHDLAVQQIERLRARAAERPAFQALWRDTWLYEADHRIEWAGRLLVFGRRDTARRQALLAEEAYARGPAAAHGSFNLGLFTARLGDGPVARAHLDRFLSLEPDGPRAAQARRLLEGLPR